MNYKLKIFLITAFAGFVLILSPARGICATDENMSNGKTQQNVDNKKIELLSGTEKNKKSCTVTIERREVLNQIEILITSNNISYRLIYMGILFAVIFYAFLALRVKESEMEF